MTTALASLVRDVDLLCLDAGNTVIFLDHARMARICAREGLAATAEELIQAEGAQKRAQEEGALVEVPWSHASSPGARSWGRTVATIVAAAGAARDSIPRLVDAMWSEHVEHNLWSLVPAGLAGALSRARAAGLRVAIVSNSEGMLVQLFDKLGIAGAFDLVVDSALVGFEKPDARIFRVALDRFGVPPERALHLGDMYATDVVGARAAGMRAALVDPYGHLAGRHADVPRVPGATEVALAIAAARGREKT